MRPPRAEYKILDLGPNQLKITGKDYTRTDFNIFKIKNCDGLNIACSLYQPFDPKEKGPLPTKTCVIYLHGNAGCRLDAMDCLDLVSFYDLSLCCFDFCGCGLSEGDFVTLGWNEKHDIEVVMEYLIEHEKFSSFILWGRSMGAVSILLYLDLLGKEQPKKLEPILGVILDSPFSNLYTLASELAQSQGKWIVTPLVSLGLYGLRKAIRKKVNFDIKEMDLLPIVGKLTTPALFLHGKDDDFVIPEHSAKLFKSYGSTQKTYQLVKGTHNCCRGSDFYDHASVFIFNTLNAAKLTEKKEPFKYVFKGQMVYTCKLIEQNVNDMKVVQPESDKTIYEKMRMVYLVIGEEGISFVQPFSVYIERIIKLKKIKGFFAFEKEAFIIDLSTKERLFLCCSEGIEMNMKIEEAIHKKLLANFKNCNIYEMVAKLSEVVRKMLQENLDPKEHTPQKITSTLLKEVKTLGVLEHLPEQELELAILDMVTQLWEEYFNKSK
uniref:Serine aminopeptidase S33 domain-containing protein n=1 Tax=Arcella intermedia TaxID=1963864 RepID=A0A6B2L2K4_9EUKA